MFRVREIGRGVGRAMRRTARAFVRAEALASEVLTRALVLGLSAPGPATRAMSEGDGAGAMPR